MRQLRSAVIAWTLAGVLIGAGASRSRASAPSGPPGPVVCFRDAAWFDGGDFVPGSRCVVDGVLREGPVPDGAQTVGLGGGFVVPAFGEAHNHNLSRPPKPKEIDRYLRAGVLYAAILNNMIPPPGEADREEGAPVEILYANGGFTGSGGHVVEHFETLVDRGVIPMRKEQLDGIAFNVVDSEADLARVWPRFLASKPDLVKAYLTASEEHAKRRSDPKFHGKRGLDPALLPALVAKAHESGLRVAAHIETAADFRAAVKAGVDMIAHLPGWRVGRDAGFEDADPGRWLLTPAEAREAARRGTIVMTTALAGSAVLKASNPDSAVIRDLHRKNLATLREGGARLVLGSDFWGGTSVTEALFLGREPAIQGVEPLGVFGNRDLLRLLSVETPRALFPDRRVGGLADGDEASFLVLEGDPIEKLSNIAKIRAIYRLGREIPLSAADHS